MAPPVFDLFREDERSALLTFIAEIRTQFHQKAPVVRIDLSAVQKLYPAATLLFVAEILRLQDDPESQTQFRCIPPKQNKPLFVFKQLGLLDHLKFGREVSPKGSDVIHWRFATGNDVRGEQFEETLGPYDGCLATPLEEGLYKSFIEATKNSKHHAYSEPRADGLNVRPDHGKWWMLSQEKEGNLTVVFCDLGIGIPNSLPKTWPESLRAFLPDVRSMGRASIDAEMIEAATQVGRTQTERVERGKGLRQICDEVLLKGGGSVVIHSNRGRYELKATSSSKPKLKLGNYKDSILGTIISWKVSLRDYENVA